MKKKFFILAILLLIVIVLITIMFNLKKVHDNKNKDNKKEGVNIEKNDNDFQIDLVYHSKSNRDIHYSAYIPKDISTLESISLYITLPGWEGLYFQGVGTNLKYEDFAYTAKELNPNMIILAPQLDDWGETSASDTIELTEYYKDKYNIKNIYINGYSGGGETLSLVLDKKPELYKRALLVSSKWDGGYENIVNSNTKIYFFIGESDSYYGSSNFKKTYNELYKRYEEKGLSKQEIDETLILDVRDHKYFTDHGMDDEHGGGGLVSHEEDIMKWLLEIK